MDLDDALMDLEETYHRLSCLLNTLGLMVLGLMQARDPYADGFNALWVDLTDADWEIQRQISACQKSAH